MSLINDVQFVDEIPAELEVLGATTTGGVVLINGQTVTFAINNIAPQDTVIVLIQTRIRADLNAAEDDLQIENVVIVTYEDCGCPASAIVVVAGELPQTGETPLWSSVIRTGAIIASVSGIIIRYRKNFSQLIDKYQPARY